MPIKYAQTATLSPGSDLQRTQKGLLIVSETLLSQRVRMGLISRSMMESWNCDIGSADLGIRVVLRRGGEVSDQDNSGCLYDKIIR